MDTDKHHKWLALTGFALVCLLVAGLGGQVTTTSVDTWYQTLNKPAFNPPDWVFPPVWTALFALMAVAGWRVWLQRRTPLRRNALTAFAVQLALNLLWSVLFFGLRSPTAALGEIVVLLTAILITLALFWRLDRLAAVLLLPYPIWVGYALALNAAIVVLN